eukprot:14554988-Alexandrium_andersonii.AAC.1
MPLGAFAPKGRGAAPRLLKLPNLRVRPGSARARTFLSRPPGISGPFISEAPEPGPQEKGRR